MSVVSQKYCQIENGQARSKLGRHTESNLQCDQCEHASESKRMLAIHMQSAHERDTNKCEQCEYEATSKTILTSLMQSTHERDTKNCNTGEKLDSEGPSIIKQNEATTEVEQYQCRQ